MPSIDQVFQSSWFNHSDVGDEGAERVYQIEEVTPGQIKDQQSGRTKPQMNIKFVGEPKTFGANKTNTTRIAGLYGKDYSQWPGQWVTLVVTKVEGPRGETLAIRVKPVKPRSNGQFPNPPHVQGIVNRQQRRPEPPAQKSYDGPEDGEYDPLG